jgi:hypothetical protein
MSCIIWQPHLLCPRSLPLAPGNSKGGSDAVRRAYFGHCRITSCAPPEFEGGIPNGAASVAASSPRCMTRQRQHMPPGTRTLNSRAHVGREQEGGRGADCLQGHDGDATEAHEMMATKAIR